MPMQFPKQATARILQGQITFLFPFNHGGGKASIFGYRPDNSMVYVLPDGNVDRLLPFSILELPCGRLVPVEEITDCIRRKVSLN